MRKQDNPIWYGLSQVWRPSRWDLVVLATALLAFGAGFLFQSTDVGTNSYWQLERLQAAVRDAMFRTSENLPTPIASSDTVRPITTMVSVSASYDQAVLHQDENFESNVPLTLLEPVVVQTPDIPLSLQLTGFKHEYQHPNNCGPATLAIVMRYWGWHGTQSTISQVVKPLLSDKNVRWDELVYYVRTQAGWLDALFRVGGDTSMLERFVSNGIPVIIETGYEIDAGWVGHYLVVSGYDREAGLFTVQDVTGGPYREISYQETVEFWEQFNRLYIIVFPVQKRGEVMQLLGDHETLDGNRYRTLDMTREGIELDSENAFAWFSYGSNLNYFKRYDEAAAAFDRARQIGLPWRMLFYQFGPYIAYFNVGRYQDIIELATANLQARPVLEESYVWRGWAQFMMGDRAGARSDFEDALRSNPNFIDAFTALEALGH